MRPIDKREAPSSLLRYRLQTGAVYDGPNFTPVKDDIRQQLLSEQGHLCAYCMRRIHADTMKIEHWHCQANYPAEQLIYANMLGVCPGNEGQPKANQTCDTYKGNNDLLYNPAYPTDHPRLEIYYDGTGKISSRNTVFDTQLNQILNLNWSRLKENRKGVLIAVMEVLGKKAGTCTRADLTALIAKWESSRHGMMHEYREVALYYLNKKLSRMNASA